MQTTFQVQILGARKAQGDVDGTPYDFTELYLIEALDPSTGNGIGAAAQPYKFGMSANFAMFQGEKFPLAADVDVMITTNGRGASRTIITGVRKVQK